jgi:hypothetical protein
MKINSGLRNETRAQRPGIAVRLPEAPFQAKSTHIVETAMTPELSENQLIG